MIVHIQHKLLSDPTKLSYEGIQAPLSHTYIF